MFIKHHSGKASVQRAPHACQAGQYEGHWTSGGKEGEEQEICALWGERKMVPQWYSGDLQSRKGELPYAPATSFLGVPSKELDFIP